MPYKTQTIEPGTELMTVNMGPSHPATHGVLRLILQVDGERVVHCEPVMGYLHRGMEKISENKTYTQFIPYTDRLDYLAPLANNVGFALAAEKLVGVRVPPRCEHIRVLICELSRISAHLLWLGTHAVDLGAITVFMYTFREREVLYNFFEALTGTRLTTSYTRVGGLTRDLPTGFLDEVGRWLARFPKELDEYETLLTKNMIWVERTQGVGILSAEDGIELGVTGPNLRASGVDWDLRKRRPYSGYEQFDFEVPIGTKGDVYDRYLVRIEEMRQSVRICRQAIDTMPGGPINVDDPKLVLPRKENVLTRMEELIHQFIIVTEGFHAPKGEVYQATEVPKGELGFHIISEGGPSPYRMKIRSPSFISLQALAGLCEGSLISDVVAIIASLDPVMGEVDR